MIFQAKKGEEERKLWERRAELSKGGHNWIIRRTRREGAEDGLWFEEGTVILKAT